MDLATTRWTRNVSRGAIDQAEIIMACAPFIAAMVPKQSAGIRAWVETYPTLCAAKN